MGRSESDEGRYNSRVPAEPVNYREPQEGDESVVRRVRARRAVWAGLWGLSISAGLMLSPLVLGRWGPNKYLVAVGFLGVCWSLSCAMHGAWDWWRGR
jgi:hypothetical protein